MKTKQQFMVTRQQFTKEQWEKIEAYLAQGKDPNFSQMAQNAVKLGINNWNEQSEKEKAVFKTFSMDKDTATKVKKVSSKTKVARAEIIRNIIMEYIEND